MASNKDCGEYVLDLECPVCSEKYEPKKFIPKKLQCGHIICKVCLKKFPELLLLCPTCKVVIKSASDLPTNSNSSTIEISSDATLESKTGITSEETLTDVPSGSEAETQSIEIPDTPPESKKEMLSKEILEDKSSIPKEEMSSVEISIDSLAKSISRDASSGSINEISSMGFPIDTSSDSKLEIQSIVTIADILSKSKEDRSNTEIPADTLSESKIEITNKEIPTDTLSESKIEITNKEIPADMSLKSEGETLSIEIPNNTLSDSKKEMTSNYISIDKSSDCRNETSNPEIFPDTSEEEEEESEEEEEEDDSAWMDSFIVPLDTESNAGILSESNREMLQMSHEGQTQQERESNIIVDRFMETSDIETNAGILSESNREMLQMSHEDETQQESETSITEPLGAEFIRSSERSEHLHEHENEDELPQIFFDSQLLEIDIRCAKRDFMLVSCYNSEIKPYFTLDHKSPKEKYISEILLEISNGNDMYVMNLEWYHTDVYWGKLTYEEDILYINSFSNEKPEYPPQYVLLSDLKKCMTSNNFRTFIDIGKYHLVCKMRKNTPQTLNFIKLCSGEDGNCYRGLNIEYGMSEEEFRGRVAFETDIPNVVEDDYKFLHSPPSEVEELDKNMMVLMQGRRCEIFSDQNIKDKWEGKPTGEVIASVSSSEGVFTYSGLTPASSIKKCGLIIIHQEKGVCALS